jgi:hypothetical protein
MEQDQLRLCGDILVYVLPGLYTRYSTLGSTLSVRADCCASRAEGQARFPFPASGEAAI